MATSDSTILESISKWTDYDRGWLSAAIDGEGYISLFKPMRKTGRIYVAAVGIANKNQAFCRRALDIVGAGSMHMVKSTGIWLAEFAPRPTAFILGEVHFIIKENRRLLVLEAIHITARRKGHIEGARTPQEIERLEAIYQELRRDSRTRDRHEQTT